MNGAGSRYSSMGKVAVVCSSNQNRSCKAQLHLMEMGIDAYSYGVGSIVKIPGKTRDDPNKYPFSTTYDEMYQDLCKKDKE
ncbi:MAG: RNA polymerase II subunit A C-terminal domain phosphatase [Paramarteilia canceri]